MNISINIGKENEEQTESIIKIQGCSCRMEDFVMALVAFANDWRKEADKQEKLKKFDNNPQTIISKSTTDVNGSTVQIMPCGGCGKKKNGK